MMQDICFCGSECDKKECMRHPSNILEPQYPHTFSNLKDTNLCPLVNNEEKD